jgi:hypothetical protein
MAQSEHYLLLHWCRKEMPEGAVLCTTKITGEKKYKNTLENSYTNVSAYWK